ncbi:MAG: SWIM zinc finger family protein [Actinobacteria bacterium]|nr:SWIM zinc finger family protein [Actinomycetota bacterium]
MVTRFARFSHSSASSGDEGAHVGFGVDLAQENAHMSGTVGPGRAFAEAMLTLGRVVGQDLGRTRDHGRYQRWVQAQYLRDLQQRLSAGIPGLTPATLQRQQQLRRQTDDLRRDLAAIPSSSTLKNARSRFWSWLYDHDRAAWLVLDPVVSVGATDTMFEAFSADESTYVRVQLPHSQVDLAGTVTAGTTNIDFSLRLERELARVRSYRPLTLSVGAGSVSLSAGSTTVIEREIDLPETWLRGLLEVQSAMVLATTTMTLDAAFVADIWAVLEGRRERTGPRSLRFELIPDEPVTAVIEPWNLRLTDTGSQHNATAPRSVRVWGRRRLAVLAPLLPRAETVTVDVVGNAMPSYWTVTVDHVTTTVGLSGWTRRDWSSRARFAGLRPTQGLAADQIALAVQLLEQEDTLTVAQAAKLLDCPPGTAAGLLHAACAQGQAMYLPGIAAYRYRSLFAGVDLGTVLEPGAEEREGLLLARDSADRVSRGFGGLVGDFPDDRSTVELDEDLHVTAATCTCWHYRWHELRQGPCRHMIATLLVGEANA